MSVPNGRSCLSRLGSLQGRLLAPSPPFPKRPQPQRQGLWSSPGRGTSKLSKIAPKVT